MEYVIIAALAALTAANTFFYIKLRLTHHNLRAQPILAAFLPFLVYAVCVLVFRWAVPMHVLLWAMAAQFVQTCFGYYLDRFERSIHFDRYMHTLLCFAYSLLLFSTLTALADGTISQLYAALFVFTIGLSVGVFIELFEFVADRWSKSPTRHQKGLRDTDMDLVSNTIGSILAGIYAYLFLG